MRTLHFLLLGAILFSYPSYVVLAQTTDAEKDQKTLAKLILLEFLDDSGDEDCKYLENNSLLTNDDVVAVNKNRKVKIALLNEAISGRALYFFRSIIVKKHAARIDFGRRWGNPGDYSFSEVVFQYKCKKSKGQWNCEVVRIENKGA